MLKRQRPVSPPLPLSIPYVPNNIPIPKRQRVLHPVLDDHTRCGMWRQDDDGEEDIHDAQRSSLPTPFPSEYISANNMLYELHALNRHRMIFSSAQSPAIHYPFSPHPPLEKSEPLESTAPYDYGPFTRSQSEISKPLGHREDEECRQVQQRYEATNRELRAAFLARRRELGGQT